MHVGGELGCFVWWIIFVNQMHNGKSSEKVQTGELLIDNITILFKDVWSIHVRHRGFILINFTGSKLRK